MSAAGEAAVNQVVQALSVLYQNPDPAAKETANAWLSEFQKSVSPLLLLDASSGCWYNRERSEVEGAPTKGHQRWACTIRRTGRWDECPARLPVPFGYCGRRSEAARARGV